MFRPVFMLFLCLLLAAVSTPAQPPKGITMDEYAKAKTFVVKDLDQVTYAKFDNNTYVLDRYEGKKPYFITGDDGLKKRVDLYSLYTRADTRHLGTVIYYTNEKGKMYTACLPNISADAAVWERYFEDIHAIDKEEKNFVLKLSYVLSKEYSFQQYKSSLKGKEIDRAEAGTYGSQICFPGDGEVLMANGDSRPLSRVQAGDRIVTIDPATRQTKIITVNTVAVHEASNYAITRLTLVRAETSYGEAGQEIRLFSRVLEATANHPIRTDRGTKEMRAVGVGEQILTLHPVSGTFAPYVVWLSEERPGGVQPVYNIDAAGGSTFLMNGVMVLQKQPERENRH